MTIADALGLSRDAARAFLALSAALDALDEAGRRTPCQRDPAPFAPDAHRYDRAEAAEACTYCPAQAPCHAFAEANDERHGVWGGLDRGLRPTRTHKTKEAA